jgi:hypothetical protein
MCSLACHLKLCFVSRIYRVSHVIYIQLTLARFSSCFIHMYASYLAHDRSQVPGLPWFPICALALISYRAILLAIPPSSRRHDFWAQCSPLCSSCCSQLLTLVSLSLPRSSSLQISQAGGFQRWRCTLSCPCYLLGTACQG